MFHLVAFGLLIPHAAAVATCYNIQGDALGSDAGLCDQSASGDGSSHSACCSNGNGDACLSTGLCLAPWSASADGLFWESGCTDSTWQDPSCPQFCASKAAGETFGNYALLACSDTTWCCSGEWQNRKFVGDKDECCKDSFTLPSSGVGSVVRQLGSATTNGASPTDCSAGSGSQSSSGSSSSGHDGTSKTAAIVGGVLGAALLATLVAAIILLISNVRLRNRLRTSHAPIDTTGGEYVSQPLYKPEMSTMQGPSYSQYVVPVASPELGQNIVQQARPELGETSVRMARPELGENPVPVPELGGTPRR